MNIHRLNWLMAMISHQSRQPQKATEKARQIALAYEERCTKKLGNALCKLFRNPHPQIKHIAYCGLVKWYQKLDPKKQAELKEYEKKSLLDGSKSY